jgi:DNA-binding CsgD family transcriptional regulator
MRPTILSAYSTLLLGIYRQAQELPVQEFQDMVLGDMKALLPFDSSMWGTATMTETGIDIHSLHLHNTTQAMIEAYQQVKHLDVAAARVAAQPIATMAFNTRRDFPGPELSAYRDFLHRFGHENTLITSEINPITQFGQWVSLWRADPGQVCTPEETELFACLAPHLMQALAINQRVHLDRFMGDVAREKWSVALADGHGVLYHADRSFLDLVALEWRSPERDRLPQILVERLVSQESQVSGAHVVVRRRVERGLLFLKARQREEVDNLSQREFLVASLLANGLTHKQVAARLGRSPETIRSQSKVVFHKLGINSVARLAAKLALRS